MKRIFCFALGNIWRWKDNKNRNNLITYIRPLEIDGVELTFGRKNELYDFKLSKTNRDWLRTLKHVTIHAPFGLVRKTEDEEEVIRQLDIIQEIYNQVNARYVVIHVPDLPSRELLNKYTFKTMTENTTRRAGVTINKLAKVLEEYPKIDLCLDVAHAYLWSDQETAKLVKKFRNKIKQVHLSGTYRKRDHQSLRVVTQRFLESIKPIKKLQVPIVLEAALPKKDLRFLRGEIEYVKSLF